MVPEFSRMAARQCPGSSVLDRMAHEGDAPDGQFVAKLVAVGMARGKIRAAEAQIFRRWQTPGRSFP
jgi:hypothetical protein